MQEPDAEIPCSKEEAGVPSPTAGEDPLMQGDTARSLQQPAATRKSLSTEETETTAELQEKTSDSTSENIEPETTAPKGRPWIWPQGFRRTGMIYVDNEGEYWALTRPPLFTEPMLNPHLMCLLRLRSEFVSAYSTGEHQKIYDRFDELALKYPSKYEHRIKIWTPNEGDGYYIPASMRNSEPEEPKKPEESEQPEKSLNFAESKHPGETMETAESEQPEQTVKTAESEKQVEAMKNVEFGNPEETLKTLESKRSQEALEAAESGGPELVTETKRTEEALKAAKSETPKKKPELAMKVDKLNKPGNPKKPIIPDKIEQPGNPAKLKKSRIPRLLKRFNIIKKQERYLIKNTSKSLLNVSQSKIKKDLF
ncbi:neurofilament heavy polypeptide-like isoform X2 [Rhinatrema bivittatum]|nr:neurofilament heavy polypeptide-like isoform X2 [Rhinatrema bivittatum]XP_029452825.1 neurofilament heavy polypeptide-like isoform X2 [Rhinatrema bivittatum]